MKKKSPKAKSEIKQINRFSSCWNMYTERTILGDFGT